MLWSWFIAFMPSWRLNMQFYWNEMHCAKIFFMPHVLVTVHRLQAFMKVKHIVLLEWNALCQNIFQASCSGHSSSPSWRLNIQFYLSEMHFVKVFWFIAFMPSWRLNIQFYWNEMHCAKIFFMPHVLVTVHRLQAFMKVKHTVLLEWNALCQNIFQASCSGHCSSPSWRLHIQFYWSEICFCN